MNSLSMALREFFGHVGQVHCDDGVLVLGETRSLWRGRTNLGLMVGHKRRCEKAGHAGETQMLMEQPNPSPQPNEPQWMLGLRRWRTQQIIWVFSSYVLWSDIYFANEKDKKRMLLSLLLLFSFLWLFS